MDLSEKITEVHRHSDTRPPDLCLAKKFPDDHLFTFGDIPSSPQLVLKGRRGEAETEVVVPVVTRVAATVRDPTVPRIVVPTAAAKHAGIAR